MPLYKLGGDVSTQESCVVDATFLSTVKSMLCGVSPHLTGARPV